MAETMTKEALLRQILEAKVEWEATSALLSPQEQTELSVAGDWKMQDIYAHLAWHERQMLDWLQAGKFIGSDWWGLPLDERNRKIYESMRDMSPEDVRQESRDVHEALVKTLETLTDAQLNDPAQWPGLPSDWPPWEVIADNTYLHYRDHSADLRRFIAGMQK